MANEFVDRIRSRSYWQVVIRPDHFDPTRIPDYDRLFPIVQDAAVSMNGWQFPLVTGWPEARTEGEDWVGEEVDWRYGLELWRLYQSGQFVSIRGMWRDWLDRTPANPLGRGPQETLPLWDTIRQFTLIYEFAARLALTEAGDAAMHVNVKFGNLKGRRLAQDDPGRTPLRWHPFTGQDFSYPSPGAKAIPREVLVAEPRQLAAEGLAKLFQRFNDFNVGVEAVRAWQEELAKR